MFLGIVLSALLFNGAFFFLEKCGWGIFLFWIPLYYSIISIKSRAFLWGCVWGLLVFGFHFIWLAHLLLFSSYASKALALSLYFCVVGYFSLTSGVWYAFTFYILKIFNSQRRVWRLIFFLGSLGTYIIFILKYGTFFLQCTKGYPFINPILPLSGYLGLGPLSYGPWRHIIFERNECAQNKCSQNKCSRGVTIVQVPLPADLFGAGIEARKRLTPAKAAHAIYHSLTNLSLTKAFPEKKDETLLIVAAESSFPYPLNSYPEVLSLWQSAMPPYAHFFIGSQRINEKGEKFQTIFWLHLGRIIKFYDKRHLVDFTERSSKHLFLSKIFHESFKEGTPFQKGKGETFFNFEGGVSFRPLICSDFFLAKVDRLSLQEPYPLILVFVNDSWFMPYFKRLLDLSVSVWSQQNKMPVVKVGHSQLVYRGTS